MAHRWMQYRAIVAAILAAWPAAWSLGLADADPPPSIAPAESDSGPEAMGLAQTTMDRARAAYAAVTTYADVSALDVVRVIDPPRHFPASPMILTLAVDAQKRFAIESDWARVVSDGRSLWISQPYMEQYLERPAPRDTAELARVLGEHGLETLGVSPLFAVLRGPEQPPLLLRSIVELAGARREPRHDRPGVRVFVRTNIAEAGAPAQVVAASLWFDDEDGLMREYAQDRTAIAAESWTMSDEPDPERGRLVSMLNVRSFRDVRVNHPLDEALFTFKPDEGQRRVEAFEPPTYEEPDQVGMLGLPAPDFTTTDLEGRAFKLADLKGKVVLLDFWATWCAPCVKGLPAMQQLADRFADRGVSVVGVNSDANTAPRRIADFLTRREISLPQALDPKGEIGRLYNVRGIPHLVLIDPEGVVQRVQVGFSPEGKESLAADIERLLAGENLVVIRPADASRRNDTPAPAVRPDEPPFDEVNPHLVEVVAEHPTQLAVWSQPSSLIFGDVNGDGVDDVIASGMQPALHVIDGRTSKVSRIRLQGAGSVAQVFPAGAAETPEGTLIPAVVSTTASRSASFDRSHEVVGFGTEGQVHWRTPVSVRAGYRLNPSFARTGNLDGDPGDEVLLAWDSYIPEPIAGGGEVHSHRQGWLAIYELDGTLRSLRQLGSNVMAVVTTNDPDAEVAQVLVISHGSIRTFRIRAPAKAP